MRQYTIYTYETIIIIIIIYNFENSKGINNINSNIIQILIQILFK